MHKPTAIRPDKKTWFEDQIKIRNTVMKKIVCYGISSLLYIHWRISLKIDYFHIFLEQINGSATIITKTAQKIYDSSLTTANLKSIFATLRSKLNNKVIFAVDEIQEFNSDDKIMSYQINDFENIGSSFDNKEKLYPLNHCIQQSLLALQVYGFFFRNKIHYERC